MSDATYITTARIRAGVSTDVLLALARERAPDPTIFDDRAPFFWLSEISNDQMDSYFGYMDAATTLPNFATDAAAGRAVLAAHRRLDLPFGSSLTGSVERTDDRTRVLADAYTLRGMRLGSVETDSFIDGVRAGVIRDISVGFSLGDAGWYRCNVCGNDLLDYGQCRHWPGMTYEIKGDDAVIRQVLATFTVVDGRLAEYSAVYDGATPSAGILKIQDAARSGLLDDRARARLEQCYRMRLPAHVLRSPGITLPAAPPTATQHDWSNERNSTMPSATNAPATDPPNRQDILPAHDPPAWLASALDAAGAPADRTVQERLTWLTDEVTRLRPLADDGRTYRTDLIAEALAAGVRAMGQQFTEETYRAILEAAPLATIKRMRDDWATLATQRLPGGRLTRDDDDDRDDGAPPAPSVPAAAHRA